MHVKSRATGQETEAYANDGEDATGQVRAALQASEFITSEVGLSQPNGRMYLIQGDRADVLEKGQVAVLKSWGWHVVGLQEFEEEYERVVD